MDDECGSSLLVFTADLDLNVQTIKARGECQESDRISTESSGEERTDVFFLIINMAALYKIKANQTNQKLQYYQWPLEVTGLERCFSLIGRCLSQSASDVAASTWFCFDCK